MLEEDTEVTMQMQNGGILEGIVKAVEVTEHTVRYTIECISNGITYIVDEIKDVSDKIH